MTGGELRTIYLVSDGTCRTCEQVIRAVLVQFDALQVRVTREAGVRDAERVRSIIAQAARESAVVFYTLVSDETRQAMQQAAQEKLVPVVDVLGPVLGSFYDMFQSAPRPTPGILYQSNKAYFDRVDAVEYTLSHDDGRNLDGLGDADVVLVGVSRSSKSTTCFYLAYRGIRAANVPLFADVDPPEQLFTLDPARVIGLQPNPHRLRSVREARLRGWGRGLNPVYAERTQVASELRAAAAQMARYGWRSLDVSYKAIEEVARDVQKLLAEAGALPRTSEETSDV